MKSPQKSPRITLTFIFVLIVFCIISITMVLVAGIIYLLMLVGVLTEFNPSDIVPAIVIFAPISIVTATVVATITSSIPLTSLNKLIKGLNQLAVGDYETRLKTSNLPVMRDISESFNLLADELQNTEMLRSDFVNNFSHEFKTPIVSIRGFAKLLQKDNLAEKQQEYLSIIVEESSRLADMATNILNLTKLENQSILTDITNFNLSEQIRNSILILEKKWSTKGLTMYADFDEFDINANEELLKQIWINLIDNSVKFSPISGEISISIKQMTDTILISIKNNGPEISADQKKRIFNKYWQGDTSHSSEGTGIGLSIARRITELHGGSISVTSSPEETIFTIELPKK